MDYLPVLVEIMQFDYKPDLNEEYETRNITIPVEVYKEIEQIAKEQGDNFDDFVVQACQFTLDKLQEEKNNKE